MHQSIRLGTGGIDGCIILTRNIYMNSTKHRQVMNHVHNMESYISPYNS